MRTEPNALQELLDEQEAHPQPPVCSCSRPRAAAKLRELKDNGIDHLAIIQHDWQRYGYGVKLPDHLPANPGYGGEEGMVLFGKVATDGAVKINRENGRLILFPYPREKPFRMALDLKAMDSGADLSRVQVRALAAGTRQDLGRVEFQKEGGRVVLHAGTPGAGRYGVTWDKVHGMGHPKEARDVLAAR